RSAREKELTMFNDLLSRLGINDVNSGVYAGRWIEQPGGEECVSLNPATGERFAAVRGASRQSYDTAIESAATAFTKWRSTPPPQRGEIVRQIGQALRAHKDDLGLLV